MKNNSVIKPIIAMIILALFTAFIFDLSKETLFTPAFFALVICTAIALIAFRKSFPDTAVFYAMITGMMVRLIYVIYTPVWCRQHDVIDFGASEGHAAYMEYILSHKALPDFDPTSVWAFFQPPLHHAVSAVWMWYNIRMGVTVERMHKNVQILPMMYMAVMIFVVYLICKEIGMRKAGTIVVMLASSLHPMFIIMSGSINNDALSVMLTVVSIYVAIRWYMYPTTGKIIALAFSIGLAMSAKFSSAMVAIPIAFLMLYKMFTDTDRLKVRSKVISYILELIPFALIVFPLGLWWPVRNKMLFNVDPGYIPDVGENIGGAGMVSRLFDVRTASPFLYMKANGYQYDEYNLVLATFKSALFDEGKFANISPLLTIIGWMLLFVSMGFAVIQIVAMIKTVTDKEAGPDKGLKLFLAIGFITFTVSYLSFVFKYSSTPSMNLRYAVPVIIIPILFEGLRVDRLTATGCIALSRMVLAVSLSFAVLSAAFYILLGLI